ncbi:MAG: hypothetical protein ACYC6M_03150 [Terriglobales bacterium]
MTAATDSVLRVPFVAASKLSSVSTGLSPFNSAQLAPPFRLPYLIRELRFMCYMANLAGSAAATFQKVQLAVGDRYITRGLVPIGMMCPQVQAATDQNFILGVDQPAGLFRWIFPKPMYCRAGEGITAFGQNSFTPSSKTVTMEIAVVGEVLPEGSPVPKTTCVPYVSAYTTDGVTPSAASDQIPFRSPWPDKILHMQRFMGRGYVTEAGRWNSITSTLSTSPLVVLVDSEDRTSITPPTGALFGEAFDARTSCLEHRRPLLPKGWFQASLQNIPANSNWWISMIGHREEAVF